MKAKRIPVRAIIAFVSTAIVAVLSSCGQGPALLTLSDEIELPAPGARLRIVLPRGSIEVLADLPAGSMSVEGTLEVFSNGAAGWSMEPAELEDIAFEIQATESMLSVYLGEEADKATFDYALSLRVPEDYAFWSGSAQEPNLVSTAGGEVVVRGLKGGDEGHRDFEIWADSPLDMFSHPAMTIEDVDGIITASAWGPMTVSGCRAILQVYSNGSRDALELRLGAIALAGLDAIIQADSGGASIYVPKDSDFTFYAETEQVVFTLRNGVFNHGEPYIAGPVEVEYDFLPKLKLTTGDGATGTFQVYSMSGALDFYAYD